MKVRVNKDSQTSRLIEALDAIRHGAGSEARIDIDHMTVTEDGFVRFCAVAPSSIEVRSSESLKTIEKQEIVVVRLRGVEVIEGCALKLRNVRLHSQTKGGFNKCILMIDADKKSDVFESTGKHVRIRSGIFGEKKKVPTPKIGPTDAELIEAFISA